MLQQRLPEGATTMVETMMTDNWYDEGDSNTHMITGSGVMDDVAPIQL